MSHASSQRGPLPPMTGCASVEFGVVGGKKVGKRMLLVRLRGILHCLFVPPEMAGLTAINASLGIVEWVAVIIQQHYLLDLNRCAVYALQLGLPLLHLLQELGASVLSIP